MASNKFAAAQKELRAFTGMLKAFTELADEIGEAGALERVVENHKRTIEQLAGEEIAAKARMDEMDKHHAAKIAEVEAKAAEIMARAEGELGRANALSAEAAATLAAAEGQSVDIVGEARGRAACIDAETDAIISAAKSKADEIIHTAKKRLAEMEAEAKAADERRSIAERDAEAARDMKANVLAEVAALRARIAVV